MPLSYKDLTAPAAEPVTLELAKQQLVLSPDFSDDDALITSYIVAARQLVEKMTNRAIFNRTMQLTMDYFPWPGWDSTIGCHSNRFYFAWYWTKLVIRLPKPGCVAINSITYADLSGNTQTLPSSSYRVDLNSEPARIVPAPGMYWPYVDNYLPGSVCVNFTAGTYGDGVATNTCPQTIVQAMLLLISHFYANREATTSAPLKEIPLGVESLLAGELFESFDLVSD